MSMTWMNLRQAQMSAGEARQLHCYVLKSACHRELCAPCKRQHSKPELETPHGAPLHMWQRLTYARQGETSIAQADVCASAL